MKRSLLMLYVIFQAASCSGQNTLDIAIQPVVSLFLELSCSHFIDKSWRKEHIKEIFHPNINFLGAPRKYENIQETLPIQSGQNLFRSAKVINSEKARAWVDYSKPSNEIEDAFFVKIEYSVIAITENGKLKSLEKPMTMHEYIILARDQSDGNYKVIDVYPSLKDAVFIGAEYFLANFSSFSKDLDLKNSLDKKLNEH